MDFFVLDMFLCLLKKNYISKHDTEWKRKIFLEKNNKSFTIFNSKQF